MKHDYDQGNYLNRNRSSSGDRRMSFRDRSRGRFIQNYGQNCRGRPQDNYRNDFRRGKIWGDAKL